MTSHDDINRRSLELACAVVRRVDADPQHAALADARRRCERWLQTAPCSDLLQWKKLLLQPWDAVRAVLLDPSETGQRLRQSNPFCGVLTPRERWDVYRRTRRHDAQPA
ncbi:MAG: hypothetical protein WCI17_11790 [bacterium]